MVGSSAISSSAMARQGHGDHRPLPHAARELMRIVVDPPLGLGNLHLAEHFDRPIAGLGLADLLMQPDRFDDLRADR